MPAPLPGRYIGQAYSGVAPRSRAPSEDSTAGLRPKAAGPRAQPPVGACQAPARRIQLVGKITSIQAVNLVHGYVSLSLILCYTTQSAYSVRLSLSLSLFYLLHYIRLCAPFFFLDPNPCVASFFGSSVTSSTSSSEEVKNKKRPHPLDTDTVAGSYTHSSGTASSAGLSVQHELSHASSLSRAVNSRRIQPACAIAEPPRATSVFQRRLRQHR